MKFNQDNTIALASIIHSECSVCTPAEQYLVGSVVINRTKNSSWPNTIDSVLSEPNQFHGRYTGNFHATASTIEIAKDLISGLYITPDIYYFCLKHVRNPPMDSIVIEGHYHYFGK